MKLQARDTSIGHRTEEGVRTKLVRIAQRAKRDKAAKFCSLSHLLYKSTLIEAFWRLSPKAAPGVDGKSKESYAENLEENITDLYSRLKSNSFMPNPVKRKYIKKIGSNKMRPLGIPAIEDKIVQTALVIILENIYEQDFLPFSYGFRPNRNCHDALKNLSRDIGTKKVGYIIDADIKGFFDNVNHEWLGKFLQHRINDSKILRLVKRFLKAGILEEGNYYESKRGVPQGGTLSPLLANIYLHYTIDLWFDRVVTKSCKGEAYITRYADDIVFCFQYKSDAQKFYSSLKDRLNKFDLKLSEDKSKMIEFGRFAQRDAKRRGETKAETFDFLGFTHYCSKSRRGRFKLKWKIARKTFTVKVNEFGEWIKENRHLAIDEIWRKVNQKLRGHYQYYGVSDNWKGLENYKREVIKLLYKWLNRRSQRNSITWEELRQLIKVFPLAEPKVKVNLNSAFV
ncbi:group II intron reverse transcriptase/maturase [Orenia metallireducens]|uniref:Group II intron reverse transcriptase/maturase n=1 Tax=Orenia metallireducens TaxID=1413210 RepID=A0A285HXY1_9FIRM|nr:group II intron reverse transcriptase/maturase [Orenia metallireducens]PRX29270.1 group II intron reverse transcriptase/maturase [Orenia metallireducens]SNY40580.1 group II intron reverse transcriptase/maturase [Orenia metallireducens]